MYANNKGCIFGVRKNLEEILFISNILYYNKILKK